GVPAAHLAVERARADAAPGLRRHRSGDGAGTRAAPRRPDAGRHAEDVPRLRRPGGPSVLPVLRLDGKRSGITGAAGESPATPRHRRVWPPAAQGNPVPSTVLAVVLAPAARVGIPPKSARHAHLPTSGSVDERHVAPPMVAELTPSGCKQCACNC